MMFVTFKPQNTAQIAITHNGVTSLGWYYCNSEWKGRLPFPETHTWAAGLCVRACVRVCVCFNLAMKLRA